MKKRKKLKISLQLVTKSKAFRKRRPLLKERRLKAIETMGQTQKRVEKTNGVVPAKKSRKSTGDTIGYLQKKAEEEELALESRKRQDDLNYRSSKQKCSKVC